MRPHKRNGKAAKARRQETARLRQAQAKQVGQLFENLTSEERLLMAIFGIWEPCNECGNDKIVKMDCMTPHCMDIREAESLYYEEVTEDHIQINGARMIAGVDY